MRDEEILRELFLLIKKCPDCATRIVQIIQKHYELLEKHSIFTILVNKVGVEKFDSLYRLKYENMLIKKKKKEVFLDNLFKKLEACSYTINRGFALSQIIYDDINVRNYKDYDILVEQKEYLLFDSIMKELNFSHCYLSDQEINKKNLLSYDCFDIIYYNKFENFSLEVKTSVRFCDKRIASRFLRETKNVLFINNYYKTLSIENHFISLLMAIYHSFFTRYGIENKFNINLLLDAYFMSIKYDFKEKFICSLLTLNNQIECSLSLLNNIFELYEINFTNVFGEYDFYELLFDIKKRTSWYYSYFNNLRLIKNKNIYINNKKISFPDEIEEFNSVNIDKNIFNIRQFKFLLSFNDDKYYISVKYKYLETLTFKLVIVDESYNSKKIVFNCNSGKLLTVYGDYKMDWVKSRIYDGFAEYIVCIDFSIIGRMEYLELFGFIDKEQNIISLFNTEHTYKVKYQI